MSFDTTSKSINVKHHSSYQCASPNLGRFLVMNAVKKRMVCVTRIAYPRLDHLRQFATKLSFIAKVIMFSRCTGCSDFPGHDVHSRLHIRRGLGRVDKDVGRLQIPVDALRAVEILQASKNLCSFDSAHTTSRIEMRLHRFK